MPTPHHTCPHPAEPDQPRVMLTVEAAAEQLSISRTSMYALIKNGSIETVKIGRLRRIPTDALTKYVNQLTQQQHAA